ncbi:MAG: hypothetical protein ABIT08_06670 [Bacteroidia bacterium]
MKTKNILTCLFILFVTVSACAQTENDSVVVNAIDPSKKEKSDDPEIQWRKITQKELLAVKHIEELLTDIPKEKFEIVSYKATFDGDDVPYFEYDIKGNEFPEAVTGNIEKSSEGTKIMIEFIKASFTDGSTRLLHPVNLLLTE